MKNVMTIDEHKALIEFDAETEMFRGSFIGLNGLVIFYGYSVDELKKEGSQSLQIFLNGCIEDRLEPYPA